MNCNHHGIGCSTLTYESSSCHLHKYWVGIHGPEASVIFIADLPVCQAAESKPSCEDSQLECVWWSGPLCRSCGPVIAVTITETPGLTRVSEIWMPSKCRAPHVFWSFLQQTLEQKPVTCKHHIPLVWGLNMIHPKEMYRFFYFVIKLMY